MAHSFTDHLTRGAAGAVRRPLLRGLEIDPRRELCRRPTAGRQLVLRNQSARPCVVCAHQLGSFGGQTTRHVVLDRQLYRRSSRLRDVRRPGQRVCPLGSGAALGIIFMTTKQNLIKSAAIALVLGSGLLWPGRLRAQADAVAPAEESTNAATNQIAAEATET